MSPPSATGALAGGSVGAAAPSWRHSRLCALRLLLLGTDRASGTPAIVAGVVITPCVARSRGRCRRGRRATTRALGAARRTSTALGVVASANGVRWQKRRTRAQPVRAKEAKLSLQSQLLRTYTGCTTARSACRQPVRGNRRNRDMRTFRMCTNCTTMCTPRRMSIGARGAEWPPVVARPLALETTAAGTFLQQFLQLVGAGCLLAEPEVRRRRTLRLPRCKVRAATAAFTVRSPRTARRAATRYTRSGCPFVASYGIWSGAGPVIAHMASVRFLGLEQDRARGDANTRSTTGA